MVHWSVTDEPAPPAPQIAEPAPAAPLSPPERIAEILEIFFFARARACRRAAAGAGSVQYFSAGEVVWLAEDSRPGAGRQSACGNSARQRRDARHRAARRRSSLTKSAPATDGTGANSKV
jgi:hypothetical protein